MLELDLPHADIATRANVSLRQVRRIKHNIIRYGTIQRPKLPAQGRKRVMTEEMEEVWVFSPDYWCRVWVHSSKENRRNTLMKWLISFGMSSMWCCRSLQSSAHFIVWTGVAKRYQFISSSKSPAKLVDTTACCWTQSRAQRGVDSTARELGRITACVYGRVSRERTYRRPEIWMGACWGPSAWIYTH